MYYSIIPIIGWIALAAILGLAVWKGAAAERLGVLATMATAVEVLLIESFTPPSIQSFLLLGADALLAGAFLFLAIRYASIWLGIAMMLQAGQFGLHAIYTAGELARDYHYALTNNLVTFGILLAILFAVLSTWRRRVVTEARAPH